MKLLIKKLVAVVSGLISLAANAATVVPDGRGNGMGNTGVTTADYVLAPFYNPALVAVYRDSDTVGILFPGIGARIRDTDKTLETVDDLQDVIKQFEANPSTPGIEDTINSYLDQLSDDKPLGVNGGVVASIALPLNSLSTNLFLRGYADVIANTDISNDSDTQTRYENSRVDTIAFGYSEFGVAIAKRLTIAGQDVSLGISPKFQTMRTYKQVLTVENFDLDDYDQSETKDDAFNLDLGAVWFYQQFRAGFAVKDLFSQKIDTLNIGGVSTYKLDTQVTVSGAYALDYFVATVDWDLTKQERFTDRNDDTQFLRFGIEGNAMGWAQLRVGYEVDLEDTLDNSITAGIGISPGDIVSLDLAGSYAGDNQYGLSGNLSFTF
ncbi:MULTISPECIES: conjugal transfer protein TraF [Vibrio]|uniref:conjugal transfer protein TraF n=1 Tax=Vibrio TaxID=662 RepID=UPI0020751286|nr:MULTISPECIES: conjugal transfer protein TraF [Vibrio]USD34232.1 conjugal transfer protein TraF [Vibrio sp. SCSIO 43186]USD47303.1 conjugal transfer protein TraF [Vibrio sp. SCSIO 43145]USD71356.1 conjugal transfer protein TraF [Vibrio sp. SCSIO 43139]USD98817.1 conjugal transfer protein TraF [Vibrio coralliilyticus]